MGKERYHREQFKNLSDSESRIASAVIATLGEQGMHGSNIREAVPTYDDAMCEEVIKGANNSHIVFGRDRYASKASGYGGQGYTQCGMLDLVAGAASSYRNLKGEYGPPDKGTIVNPNFMSDAARIYISQKCDIDKYFGLALGSEGIKPDTEKSLSYSRSGIGLKADHVRVIARRHIKLVTGRGLYKGQGSGGEKNSAGGVGEYTGGIDLLAGNYSEDEPVSIVDLLKRSLTGDLTEAIIGRTIPKLQPVVKGDNLVECLKKMNKTIQNVKSLAVANAVVISKLSATTGGAFATSARTAGFTSGTVLVALNSVQTAYNALSSTYNDGIVELNYLSPIGRVYINSNYVKTT